MNAQTYAQAAPAAAEFNGHPSYDHWNVALWFGNDEGLYIWALNSPDADTFADELESAGFDETDDGVTITRELAVYAWESVNEE